VRGRERLRGPLVFGAELSLLLPAARHRLPWAGVSAVTDLGPRANGFSNGGHSDEDLMARYVSGDLRAFEALFARLGPRVHGFFRRAFGDQAVADDLMQTTFLKLHRAKAAYDPARPLRPWLFTIAASVRRDELRRRYRLPSTAGEEELARAEAADPDPTLHQLKAETADAVRAALARLPESQRTVVHLHRYEELTFEQIAEVLGTSNGAVRVRACRAYERLRRELQPWLAEEAEVDP
jgi:RNA polymerase sigma factor (sigma-70 family)